MEMRQVMGLLAARSCDRASARYCRVHASVSGGRSSGGSCAEGGGGGGWVGVIHPASRCWARATRAVCVTRRSGTQDPPSPPATHLHVPVPAGGAEGAEAQPVVDALLLVGVGRVLELAPLHGAPAAAAALGHAVLVLHVQEVAALALVADPLDPELAHHPLEPGVRRLRGQRQEGRHGNRTRWGGEGRPTWSCKEAAPHQSQGTRALCGTVGVVAVEGVEGGGGQG
jgi:hypothetical protein